MKILIDGIGFIGEVHLRILQKYNLADISILEKDKSRLQEIVKKYNIKEYFTDISEIKNKRFDGSIICTPNNLHAEHGKILSNISYGIMIEKPMTITLTEAEELLKFFQNKDNKVLIAYCLRFYDPIVKIKEIIENFELGEIFSFKALVSSRKALTDAKSDYRKNKSVSGSIIHDYSHEIDYLQLFMPYNVTEIYCRGFNLYHDNYDSYDTVDIMMTFNERISGSIHLDYLQAPFRRTIELYGNKGTLVWEDFKDIKLYTDSWGKWITIRVDNDFEKMYYLQLKNFLNCILKKEDPEVSVEDGANIIRIIDACTESALKNIKIKLN